jgi:hypothetical protein
MSVSLRGEFVMKARKLSLALFALALYAASAHATGTSGTIRFIGYVFEPASASLVSDTSTVYAPVAEKHVDSVSHAQTALRSDVLDYFAAYAGKGAKLVTVSFQ